MLDRSRSAWACAQENSPQVVAVEEDAVQGADPMMIHASDWTLCGAESFIHVKCDGRFFAHRA
jgi:hypothetical protein